MSTAPSANPDKAKKTKALEDAALGLLQGQLKQAAMQGLKFVAGMAYEGNRAICDDPNTRFIEKTFCMVMKGLSGGGSGDQIKQNIDKILSTLKDVDSKVTEINANVKTILKEIDLLRLEVAEGIIGAEAFKAIGRIHDEYPRFLKSLDDLKDHPERTLAYYTEVITDTKLNRQIDTVFHALTKEIATKDPLLGNAIRQIEVKGANESLLNCYRIYEEYVNSILLDLRKGNVIVSTALLYFETLRQNGKLAGDLAERLGDLGINNQIWQKHWDAQIDTLLDHYNTHWDRFAIDRSSMAGTDGPAPAQGINPFFFPDDARESFRAADAFCASQQEKYGIRGRVFSMGGQFNGDLKFKDGTSATPAKNATFTIGRKLDYWTASQPGVYDKVEFSNQWTVHRYHIPNATAGAKQLDLALPYTPPPVEVVRCDRQTLQPSALEGAAEFGSFVEIARVGGTFAFLSGAWNPGNEDHDPSNTAMRLAVGKVEELRRLVEFKIRAQERAIGKASRPEVGLAKLGSLRHTGSHSLEGTFRTWLESAKTIEFPTTSADEHISLVWSVDRTQRAYSELTSADLLNKTLRGAPLRPCQPKSSISENEMLTKRFILGVNYDPTFAIPDQGCRLRAGFVLYPVWNGQNAEAAWSYPALLNGAAAGRLQVGVFREAEDTKTTVSEILVDVYNHRKLRFRFESYYDLRVETSGLDETPFVIYTRAELANAYVELNPGPAGTPLDPAGVTLKAMLARPAGRCFAFDYDHSGLLDHVAFFDTGYLMVYGQVGSRRLERRPLSWGTGREWELKRPGDGVFGFDYEGTERLDHFVVYRPGEGKISILRNNHGVLDVVWRSDQGLEKFDLKNAADRGLAFDFASSGKADHLLFYRPGLLCIWGKRSSGGFGIVYESSTTTGNYRLDHSADRVFPFDYEGTGRADHLMLYRPGAGKVSIVKRSGAAFTPVYDSETLGNKGIGKYDLRQAADHALAFDCEGSGHMNHLVFYRPSRGAIYIFKANHQKSFDLPVYRRNEGDPGRGIADYDLKSPADRMIAFDFNGTGQSDHLLIYRPGTGHYSVIKKTGKPESNEFVRVI